MIFSNVIGALTSDSNTPWVALLSIVVFGVYFLFFDTFFESSGRQISLLPSMTKNQWDSLILSLKLASFRPRDILPFFDTVIKKYGSLIHFKIIARHYIILNDPDDIKVLLSSVQHITKGPDYEMLEPWLNKGLLTSTDHKWHSRRKLLTNTFHFKILETYMPSLNHHSRSLIKNLINASDNGKSIADIDSHVTLCALDIVCETIMGVNLRSQEGKSMDYVKAIKNVSQILIRRIFTFWYWNEIVFNLSSISRDFRKSLKLLHDFTENVIQEKRKILEAEQKKSNESEKKRIYSFLDLLVGVSKENPDVVTDKDIREEVDTFLFEGHDTSSIAITMAIIHLGLDQNIQNLVRDELCEIFGDSDRDATMEDLKAMTNLERVIKETMRLYPSVTGITRTLKEPLRLDKYTIPSKSVMAVIPHLLHRDENIYPNPEKFDPDRFLPEQCIGRHPYAYIPFSAGPRNCIGQKFAMYQMKTVLSTILRYTIVETLGTKESIIISTQLIMRADYLPNVKITPISNSKFTRRIL
ncbi:PREDICTED: cytochrome P450 4C1-like [Diuraphis noxia]|uniref:cytochrome P450 4C1-like n=1 Tax=Diuraphis noxia TaxID=143948 RepID=UPI000763AE05|nr:PREDICTED: cytochrome P450 4C1-like [Diuraphis noxia]